MEASHAHRRADHENERNFEEGVDSGGRARVPRRAARGAQQLPARARRKGDKPRANVGVPTEADGRSESRPAEQREAGADPGGQGKIHGPLQEPAEVPQTGATSEKGAPGDRVRPRALDGAVYPDEHRVSEAGEKRIRDHLLQADEQLRVQQNDEKPEEPCGREDRTELGR